MKLPISNRTIAVGSIAAGLVAGSFIPVNAEQNVAQYITDEYIIALIDRRIKETSPQLTSSASSSSSSSMVNESSSASSEVSSVASSVSSESVAPVAAVQEQPVVQETPVVQSEASSSSVAEPVKSERQIKFEKFWNDFRYRNGTKSIEVDENGNPKSIVIEQPPENGLPVQYTCTIDGCINPLNKKTIGWEEIQ